MNKIGSFENNPDICFYPAFGANRVASCFDEKGNVSFFVEEIKGGTLALVNEVYFEGKRGITSLTQEIEGAGKVREVFEAMSFSVRQLSDSSFKLYINGRLPGGQENDAVDLRNTLYEMSQNVGSMRELVGRWL